MRVWYECLSICSEYRNSHLNFTKQAVTLSDLFPIHIVYSSFNILLLTCQILINFEFHNSKLYYLHLIHISCHVLTIIFWLYLLHYNLSIISDLKYSVTSNDVALLWNQISISFNFKCVAHQSKLKLIWGCKCMALKFRF